MLINDAFVRNQKTPNDLAVMNPKEIKIWKCKKCQKWAYAKCHPQIARHFCSLPCGSWTKQTFLWQESILLMWSPKKYMGEKMWCISSASAVLQSILNGSLLNIPIQRFFTFVFFFFLFWSFLSSDYLQITTTPTQQHYFSKNS